MTATSLRRDLDGDAGVVHVAIPSGCHTPRVLFSADDQRVLSQLLQSRRGAQAGLGGQIVTWTEGDVAIRVEVADSATETPQPHALAADEVPAAPAAAATPPTSSVSVPRRRRTSGTLNLSRRQTETLERGVDLLLEAHHADLDRDDLLAIKDKVERLPHREAVA